MINDILLGVLLGFEAASIGLCALCAFAYWVRIGNENDTTYFRFVMLLIPAGFVAYEAEEKARSIFKYPIATIIPAVAVMILCVITGVCIIVKELKRGN